MSEEILANRYVIEQQLAKKAGRRTLLARDRETQDLVVIKLLTFSKDFAWEDLKLFEREAETLKTLSHPAIPEYVDYFELPKKSKSYALVQTYVEGKSLEEYIQSGRLLRETEIKHIAIQLLELLIYLHSQHPPVIHRDIKPSNIIVRENKYGGIGRVYLVDFGSVQTLASKAGSTVTVVGTYGYMPPEQFGGYSTPASDLYSLGATLIALATGIHPADLPQKEMKIGFEDLVNFHPTLVGWLQWLTEPSQEKRLSSATQALKTLKAKQTSLDFNNHRLVSSKRINGWWLFISSILRTTFIGGGILVACASLYCTIFIPVAGTVMGAIFGGIIGFPLGLVNGLFNALITRCFFYPPKNPNLHQKVLNITSMIISVAVAVVFFNSILDEFTGSDRSHLQNLLFFVINPSIITGLSLGAASKSFGKWYEKESRVKLFDRSFF